MFKKFYLLMAIPALIVAANSLADDWGNGFVATGPTQQASASGTSASVTLSPRTSSAYVLVWNEGTVFSYVTCTASTATTPGGAGPNSTPVGPSGGILLYVPAGATKCAAVTAGTAANVDFTPGNLF